jgi:hypothetical protein
MHIMTQRAANVSTIPRGITSGEAQCNSDEVVTGGGYDIPKSIIVPPPNTVVLPIAIFIQCFELNRIVSLGFDYIFSFLDL